MLSYRTVTSWDVFRMMRVHTDPNKKIELRPDEEFGDIKYLAVLLPDLVQHLSYLKLKIIKDNGCTMATSWKFPITIK